MTVKPWKVISSQRLYKHIRLDQCVFPDDNVYEVPILEHKNWVTIIALTGDEQVVLERQYRHGMQQVILEFPGGVIESGETVEAAARRELLEETGYGGGRFIALSSVSPDPADHTNLLFPFLALGVEKISAQHLDATEELDVLLKPLDDVIALARSGGMPQALHVSALFFALAYMGRAG